MRNFKIGVVAIFSIFAIFAINSIGVVSQNVSDNCEAMQARARFKAYYFGQVMPEFNFTIRFGMRPYVSEVGWSRFEFNNYMTKTCAQVLAKEKAKIDCKNDELSTTWEYLCNCMTPTLESKIIQITAAVLEQVLQVLVDLGRVLGND